MLRAHPRERRENREPEFRRTGIGGGLLPWKAGSLLILRLCRDDKE